MTKEELIVKIKKLQAMSESSNPNEAAIAHSIIQKLMETYSLEASDLDEGSIGEICLYPVTGLKDLSLAGKIGAILEKALGVQSILYKKSASSLSHLVIIGPDAVLKSCEYVYTLLCRYLINARKDYDKVVWYDILKLVLAIDVNREQLKRQNSPFYENFIVKHFDPYIKEHGLYDIFYKDKDHDENDPLIKRAKSTLSAAFKEALLVDSDRYPTRMLKEELSAVASKNRKAFMNGYLNSIAVKIEEYALTEKEAGDIEGYTKKHYPALKITVKRGPRSKNGAQMSAYDRGLREGRKAAFNQAVENYAPERARITKK